MPQVVLFENTKENRPALLRVAIQMYIGVKCKFCSYVFNSVEDIIERDVVKAGDDEYACHSCWQSRNAF
jgi:hypothetical protein